MKSLFFPCETVDLCDEFLMTFFFWCNSKLSWWNCRNFLKFIRNKISLIESKVTWKNLDCRYFSTSRTFDDLKVQQFLNISSTGIAVASKNVVICGRSKNVGLAVAMVLHSDQNSPLPGYGATVTVCHKDTPQKELEEHLKKADIIVTSMGKYDI